ncbi:hypothetical protein E3226_000510 [Legionella geestiana]|uniref:hypothetical protein n=1 Tax=Legionella geestiana TaxID=45065 RepID=UPI001091C4F3|nr:hypothetical protein [Legionella geestiana]QDQ38992.1 hypothetical protein E3226_000510 [Legionella geestiana]
MSGFSDARETIRATFIKLYLKKAGANTENPSWTDMLRGVTGWPHPRAEGHFKSYPFIPFEFVLNILKMLLVFLPFAVSVLLAKALAAPLLNLSSAALRSDSIKEKIFGASCGVASFFLFALSIPPAIAAWLGYSATAINDSRELARVHVGSIASWFNYALSVAIHMAILTFLWPVYLGFIGVKVLTLCNEYLQMSAAYPDEVKTFWESVSDTFSNGIRKEYANVTGSLNSMFINSQSQTGPSVVVYAVVPVASANNHAAAHFPPPVALSTVTQPPLSASLDTLPPADKPETQLTSQ